MALHKKIIICFSANILVLLLLPTLMINLIHSDAAMGLIFVFFFAVVPILSVCMGILSTSHRKLWWIPIMPPLLFPPLFWIAISEIVWELYIYSVFYLFIGCAVMLCASLINTHKKRKTENNNGRNQV